MDGDSPDLMGKADDPSVVEPLLLRERAETGQQALRYVTRVENQFLHTLPFSDKGYFRVSG